MHEFGHHFAGLADEYYTSPVETLPVQNVVEPWEPNVTALLDPAKLKWRDLVRRDTKLPTPWLKQEFEERRARFPGQTPHRSVPTIDPNPRCRRCFAKSSR